MDPVIWSHTGEWSITVYSNTGITGLIAVFIKPNQVAKIDSTFIRPGLRARLLPKLLLEMEAKSRMLEVLEAWGWGKSGQKPERRLGGAEHVRDFLQP